MENENPKEVILTSEKVVMAIIGLIMFISGVATLFAAIWCRWYIFKLSLTIFLAMVIGTAVGYYIANHIGKLFKK